MYCYTRYTSARFFQQLLLLVSGIQQNARAGAEGCESNRSPTMTERALLDAYEYLVSCLDGFFYLMRVLYVFPVSAKRWAPRRGSALAWLLCWTAAPSMLLAVTELWWQGYGLGCSIYFVPSPRYHFLPCEMVNKKIHNSNYGSHAWLESESTTAAAVL